MKLLFTKQEAIECRMTHEGRICGVPCWMHDDGEQVFGVPKFLPFRAWLWLCDKAYDLATHFMTEDYFIEFPMKVGKPISEA